MCFGTFSKAIVDQYLTSIAMKHRFFTQDALSCWTDAYEEVCGNSSGIIDDMKTNFVKDIAKSSKSTDFAFITTAPVADTDEGDIDVLLEENNEGVPFFRARDGAFLLRSRRSRSLRPTLFAHSARNDECAE